METQLSSASEDSSYSTTVSQGYVLPEGKIMPNTIFVGGIDVKVHTCFQLFEISIGYGSGISGNVVHVLVWIFCLFVVVGFFSSPLLMHAFANPEGI